MLPSKRQIGLSSGTPAEHWAELVQRTSACGRELRRCLADCLAGLELNDSEFFVLFSCRRTASQETAIQETGQGVAQYELAATVGLSPAQLSGLVERLGKRGLIVSERSGADRRKQFWSLTSGGRQFLQQALDRLAAMVERLNARLLPSQQQVLQQLLHCLTGACREAPLPRIYRETNNVNHVEKGPTP